MKERIGISDQESPPSPGSDISGLEFNVTSLAAGGSRRQDKKKITSLNNAVGYLVPLIVFAAAVPAASNRPVFWLFWSGFILLISSAYLVTSARIAPERRLRFLVDRQWQAPAIVVLFLIGVFLQTLSTPFGLNLPIDSSQETTSLFPEASRLGVIRIFGYIALFGLMVEIAAMRARTERIAWFVFGVICLHAAWAMISLKFMDDTFFWGEKVAYQGVATGTFINRNSFATFLGMGFILGLSLSYDLVDTLRIRTAGTMALYGKLMLPLLGLLLIGISLFATQSRMGVFSTIFGSAAAYLILQLKSGRSLLKHSLILIGGGAALVSFWFLMSGNGFFDRLLMLKQNSETRALLWRQVIEMISDRPWTGFGLDSFAPAFELYHSRPLSSSLIWEYTHSSYLNLWVETGLILGTLPLVAACLIAARLLRQIWKAEAKFAVNVAALAVLLQCALHSLVDFSLEMPANMYLFLVILGLGSAARRRAPTSQ